MSFNPPHTPYLVAETGINHNGDADLLQALVRAAIECRFSAVKFQYFLVDTLDRPAEVRAKLADVALPLTDIVVAANMARTLGLGVILTTFCGESLAAAEAHGFEWDAYKLSHIESTDEQRVEAVKATGRPYILSAKWGCKFTEAEQSLWCCGHYPTPINDVAWTALRYYAGFSDHTGDVRAGGLAAAFGAKIIEAHVALTPGGLDEPVNIVGKDRMLQYAKLAKQMGEAA
jgi:N,N'-diacetyllegionaminate synthase